MALLAPTADEVRLLEWFAASVQGRTLSPAQRQFEHDYRRGLQEEQPVLRALSAFGLRSTGAARAVVHADAGQRAVMFLDAMAVLMSMRSQRRMNYDEAFGVHQNSRFYQPVFETLPVAARVALADAVRDLEQVIARNENALRYGPSRLSEVVRTTPPHRSSGAVSLQDEVASIVASAKVSLQSEPQEVRATVRRTAGDPYVARAVGSMSTMEQAATLSAYGAGALPVSRDSKALLRSLHRVEKHGVFGALLNPMVVPLAAECMLLRLAGVDATLADAHLKQLQSSGGTPTLYNVVTTLGAAQKPASPVVEAALDRQRKTSVSLGVLASSPGWHAAQREEVAGLWLDLVTRLSRVRTMGLDAWPHGVQQTFLTHDLVMANLERASGAVPLKAAKAVLAADGLSAPRVGAQGLTISD